LIIGATGMLATDSRPVSAANEVNAVIGGGEAGIAVNVFSPAAITVKVGDTVTWTNPYTEPHSVAFQADDGVEIVEAEAALNKREGRSFDGRRTFSSGLFAAAGMWAANGSSYSVWFQELGDYTFFCTIHPGMEVTVSVVESETPAIDEDAIDQRIDKGLKLGLAAADAIKVPGPTTGSNGKKVWTIPTPPSVPYEGSVVDVLRFTPAEINIGAGDTVTWQNDSFTPHTVTFLPGPPPEGFSPFVPAVSSTNYSPGTFLNSGIIVNDQIGDVFGGIGQSFSLTFDKPGTYQYICALHADSGMVGVINVGAAGSGGIAPPNTGDAGLLDQSSGSWMMLGGSVMLLFGLGAGLAMSVRRSR
jgi:plastocyanin